MEKTRAYENIHLDGLPSRAILVWQYLCSRCGKGNQCWPSVRRVAQDLNLSVSTVKRALQDLESSRWIQREQRWKPNGGKTSVLYTVKR